MASESHNVAVSRSIARCAGSRSQPDARRPAVGYWFGSDNSATSPGPSLCASSGSPEPLRSALPGSVETPGTCVPRSSRHRSWRHSLASADASRSSAGSTPLQRPSLHNLLRPSLAFVRPLRRYYAAVRLPAAVHLGLIAHRLLPPFRRPSDHGRPRGLSVLAREVSMHAWGLRLRRAGRTRVSRAT